MTTFFDLITVACFVGVIIVFFQFTDREIRTLIHFILVGIVLAVANQLGNAGSLVLAAALILAGAAYVGVLVRR